MLVKEEDKEITMHAGTSPLLKYAQPWVKKQICSMFGITVGSFDGEEVYELASVYFLHQYSEHIDPGWIGLYRDDGLAIFKSPSGNASKRSPPDFWCGSARLAFLSYREFFTSLYWFCPPFW